ncbi:MAG: DUF808 domain-containing protein [Pseudomonadales bacterium]|nr:DUF808 domain-containing protein [Pseudomonadales bacterium]
MAGGILAILDDVAILLDDAVVMSKVAAKKTAGILGDDLAVNAEKATGFHASRELPVIWEITKGSFINKLIILPIAFLLSAYMPFLIVPILLIGGSYLCYEGVEKIMEWFVPHERAVIAAQETANPKELIKRESTKIKAAVRTDFILSIEIVVIALGSVMDQHLVLQIMVVGFVALLATVGVYGFVALLVRMDDTGFYLIERADNMKGFGKRGVKLSGEALVAALPKVIRLLGVVGTVAMLLVGGGMFVHNIEAVHHALAIFPGLTADFTAGIIVGLISLLVMKIAHAVK